MDKWKDFNIQDYLLLEKRWKKRLGRGILDSLKYSNMDRFLKNKINWSLIRVFLFLSSR